MAIEAVVPPEYSALLFSDADSSRELVDGLDLSFLRMCGAANLEDLGLRERSKLWHVSLHIMILYVLMNTIKPDSVQAMCISAC